VSRVPLHALLRSLTGRIEEALATDSADAECRRLVREDLTAWSLAAIALCLADKHTVELEPAEWWIVQILRYGEAEWVDHSEHPHKDCADRCAADAVRYSVAREARVVPYGTWHEAHEAPPW
jgi:hypothetical protein